MQYPSNMYVTYFIFRDINQGASIAYLLYLPVIEKENLYLYLDEGSQIFYVGCPLVAWMPS